MQAHRKRLLTITEILDWATRCKETTGRWPTRNSGAIPGSNGETWSAVDSALRAGLRDLPAGSSIARLLAEKYGARNVRDLPRLTETYILAWADTHYRRTGTWPSTHSGMIPDSGGEKWLLIDNALRRGLRGLPGGSSLPKLLALHRDVRNRKGLPKLTEEQILAWADVHHERTGRRPNNHSGQITDAPGETWSAINYALQCGKRGLPGGRTLASLLDEAGHRTPTARRMSDSK